MTNKLILCFALWLAALQIPFGSAERNLAVTVSIDIGF